MPKCRQTRNFLRATFYPTFYGPMAGVAYVKKKKKEERSDSIEYEEEITETTMIPE